MGASPLRVGIVGYGLAGAVFHAPLVAATPGLEVACIVTRSPERQTRARREHPDARVVEDVAAVWEADLDLVVLATPNDAHVPLGLTAVQAGLAVVVDKPLAITAADGRRLVAAAAERGVPLTVFHNRRWDGDFRTVRRLVADGTLGRVLRLESRFERWRPAARPGAWRENAPPEEGGGLLLDLGSHLVDQAVALLGAPTRVYAEVASHRDDVRGDDDVFLALTCADGVRAHLWASALAAQRGPRFRVLGTRGAYVKDGLDAQEETLRAGHRPGGPGWGAEPPERWGRLGVDGSARTLPSEPGAYPAFYAGVVAMVRDGAPPPVAPEEAVAVLDILEAARTSAAEGRVVDL